MLNVTSRLGVKIKYLPPGEINWSDTTPQKCRSTLTISDLIPNERDGEEMYSRAVHYVMRFLTTTFKAFHKFQKEVPPLKSPHTASKSQVAPLKVLEKDEKYTEVNIAILESFRCDAQLSCDPQVCKHA